MNGGYTALVLAGSRGPSDPVAEAAGVRHKALAPVDGVPMLVRVVEALHASPSIGAIVLAADGLDLADTLPALAPLRLSGALEVVSAAASPASSVLAVLDSGAAGLPILVTTADHPLLTPAMVEHFLAQAPPDADAAAALARAGVIRAAHPGAVRTYLRFRDASVSGCNLFLLRTGRARRVVDFWRRVEANRKRPWRMMALLGPWAIVRFAFRRLSLDDALRLLSRRTGARLAAIDMPMADAAIDVDKPADLALANAILRRRRESASTPGLTS